MSGYDHQDFDGTGPGLDFSQLDPDDSPETQDIEYRQLDRDIDYKDDDVHYQQAPTLTNSKPDNTSKDDSTSDAGIMVGVQELCRADAKSAWRSMAAGDIQPKIEDTTRKQKYALIVRREKISKNSVLALHSITVKCQLMRQILGRVFEHYEGIDMKLKEVTFEAPFREFYHRWHRFEKICTEQHPEQQRQHLGLLFKLIRKEVLPHVEATQDMIQSGVISYKYLWAIFPPNIHICSKVNGQDRFYLFKRSAYQTLSGLGRTPGFIVSCQYIDSDGVLVGYVDKTIFIYPFCGTQKITDLQVFPSHLHPDIEALVDKLHSRGRQLEKLNGFNHVSYSGELIELQQVYTGEHRRVENARIIVDPQSYWVYNRNHEHPNPRPSKEVRSTPKASGVNVKDSVSNALSEIVGAAAENFRELVDRYERNRASSGSKFYVDSIRPIQWTENSLNELVLPKGYKDIMYAFVNEQLCHNNVYKSVIESKGQGFIMLLSGEPGVGKTLTAESGTVLSRSEERGSLHGTVCEEMKTPLLYMTAGELGEDAATLERTLNLILDLAVKWHAVLLLDECDMFLARRTTANIHRNRLVSVFLTKLEYYTGILFLTTNRISAFDPAFESRIHLSVNYPALDLDSRMRIWRTAIHGASQADRDSSSDGEAVTVKTLADVPVDNTSQITEQQLQLLAKHKLNGREIKNTVKAASLLAKRDNSMSVYGHLDWVLRVKKESFPSGWQLQGASAAARFRGFLRKLLSPT
ncbi:hypothetical protein H2200_003872 [Cladophialophora chaetospira]|uniref:AAA+ ATPase domain-containing protein n=1 Tax=Cladophialophora chaetospira TaxID=386627 RepID=A0AA39CL48_9EURO|nr:hypothetical protein H2200_003872 [Cladophialophora chaetospira]